MKPEEALDLFAAQGIVCTALAFKLRIGWIGLFFTKGDCSFAAYLSFFFFFSQLPLRNEETEADRIWPSLVAPEQAASPPGSMLADPSPLLPPVLVGVPFLTVSL